MNPSVNNTFNILKMQAVMESMGCGTEGIPDATHVYTGDVCARTLILPKGSVIVGKMHRHEHLNIISYGHVKVLTFEGSKEYIGHNVFVSPATVKRCVYAVEETCWTVIHATTADNEEDLEHSEIIKDDSPEFLEKIKLLIGDS